MTGVFRKLRQPSVSPAAPHLGQALLGPAENKPIICKFFLKNKCSSGDQCKFIHDLEVCKNYFFDGVCKRGDGCKFKHQYKLSEREPIGVFRKLHQPAASPVAPHPGYSISEDQRDGDIQALLGSTENKNEQNDSKPSKYDKNKERNKQQQQQQQRRRPKNTQNFKPCHDLLDMNILVPPHDSKSFYKTIYGVNDVVIVPDFIKELDNDVDGNGNGIYEQLITEIRESGINEADLWKSWHGDTHFIADDNLQWKEKVPTFSKILEKIETYFHFKIKSTRLNWYKNTTDWKPYHHDAAAIKENIAKNQNFTIGVSFGHTRSIAFEHAKTRTTISIPMTNGSAYAFSRDINVNWKHGIPQINPEKYSEEGRISIIAWGMVDLE